MQIATLILDYLKALVWPAAVVCGLLMFRGSVRALLGRITTQSEEISATAFGASI